MNTDSSAEKRGTLKSELVSKTILHYLSSIVIAVLGFVFLYLATHNIGYSDYGMVAFGLSFGGILVFITDFGFVRSHTKKVSEGADLQACLSTYLIIRIALTTIYVIITLSIMLIGGGFFLGEMDYEDLSIIMVFILIHYMVLSISQTYISTMLALRRVSHAQSILIMEIIIRVAAAVWVIFSDGGAVGLAMAYGISGTASLVICIAIASRTLPRISLKSIDKALFREYSLFAYPLALTSILGVIAVYADKVLIQIFLSSEQTGIYYASQSFLNSILFTIGNSLIAISFPAISMLNVREGGTAAIRKLINGQMRYLCLIIIPLVAFFSIFSKEIMTITLSSTAINGFQVFSILSIAAGIFIFTMPSSQQILGMGFVKEYARYNIAYFVSIMSLDLLLIPGAVAYPNSFGFGISGAALAMLCSQIIMFILFTRKSHSMIGFSRPKGAARIIASSLIAVTLTYSIIQVLDFSIFSELIIAIVVFLALYLLILISSKAASVAEIKEFIGDSGIAGKR